MTALAPRINLIECTQCRAVISRTLCGPSTRQIVPAAAQIIDAALRPWCLRFELLTGLGNVAIAGLVLSKRIEILGAIARPRLRFSSEGVKKFRHDQLLHRGHSHDPNGSNAMGESLVSKYRTIKTVIRHV